MMQRKTPLTPQSRRLNRPTSRATMAPGDFSMAAGPSNQLLLHSRQSTVPNQRSARDAGKKQELETKKKEIMDSYNRYLQSEMALILMRKKAEEREKLVTTQLVAAMKEEDVIRNNLEILKTRERDLESLIGLQNGLDDQIVKIQSCLADLDKKPVEILKMLASMLESLDILKCKNIIIPETKEEMTRVYQLLQNCDSLLQAINTTINERRKALIGVNTGLKDFEKTYGDIQDCSNKCANALDQLQKLVLKNGADSLKMAGPLE